MSGPPGWVHTWMPWASAKAANAASSCALNGSRWRNTKAVAVSLTAISICGTRSAIDSCEINACSSGTRAEIRGGSTGHSRMSTM